MLAGGRTQLCGLQLGASELSFAIWKEKRTVSVRKSIVLKTVQTSMSTLKQRKGAAPKADAEVVFKKSKAVQSLFERYPLLQGMTEVRTRFRIVSALLLFYALPHCSRATRCATRLAFRCASPSLMRCTTGCAARCATRLAFRCASPSPMRCTTGCAARCATLRYTPLLSSDCKAFTLLFNAFAQRLQWC
jgi:hypothetical protein